MARRPRQTTAHAATPAPFLPTTRQEMDALGWDACDVVLVSGDAYVDHPTFGAAMIGRLLEREGWRVGIIAQPDWRTADDFAVLGAPRLFVGITSGNVDSMVANLSANRQRRRTDDYSPGGKAGRRPDRAVLVYANRVREALPGVPVVLGGLEASLRRLAHYDYWDDAVRRSVLVDTRADILVYGMGEAPIAEIARRLTAGGAGADLTGIPGTATVAADDQAPDAAVMLPSFDTVAGDREAYGEAFRLAQLELAPDTARPVVQPHGDRLVVQWPPARPLSQADLDALYELPFRRTWHPRYDDEGGVPALETVRTSITAHRGCCGDCSFCAITSHQGRIVTSRSEASIVAEARRIAADPGFKGTISDVGGPTANLYGARCNRWDRGRFCRHRHCLLPERCEHLQLGYDAAIRLYRKVADVPGVKHVFLGSGLRFDLLVRDSDRRYLEQIAAHQVSGLLKIAPEHGDDRVLALMAKPSFAVYEEFLKRFRAASRKAGKQQYVVNYFIASHPGSSLREALKLALYLAKRRVKPEQIQDFIPTPMTRATCMYHTGRDPLTRKAVHVPRTLQERRMQRALLQYDKPANRKLLEAALTEIDAMHVLPKFLAAATARGTGSPGPAPRRGPAAAAGRKGRTGGRGDVLGKRSEEGRRGGRAGRGRPATGKPRRRRS
jgi:uncharacterized radical SAM protein YgiQ